MTWTVYLWGIEWDSGKGEYDVSDLPRNLCLEGVIADTQSEAVEHGMNAASDQCGSLIDGVREVLAVLEESENDLELEE